MKQKCKTCGKNAEGEYCFQHKPRKEMKKTVLKAAKHFSEYNNTMGKMEKLLEMQLFFLSIWKKRPHKSEISGESLGNEALSIFFHHILEKNKYPEACLDEENIILLSFQEHQNVENDMYKYEKINKKREQLKIKYNII